MTRGEFTSEYQVQKNASVWSNIGLVLGFITSSAGVILPAFTQLGNQTIIVIAGAVVSVAAILQRTLTDMGYIKSRIVLKINESKNP